MKFLTSQKAWDRIKPEKGVLALLRSFFLSFFRSFVSSRQTLHQPIVENLIDGREFE